MIFVGVGGGGGMFGAPQIISLVHPFKRHYPVKKETKVDGPEISDVHFLKSFKIKTATTNN